MGEFMKTSDFMTDWICPDITAFYLLNNPDTYYLGKNFKLVIDYCDQTTSSDCITDETERRNFIKQITVNSKVVSQYFNPRVFEETNKLSYASS